MEKDCIVCAKTFFEEHDERLTCSDECKKKWANHLEVVKHLPEEEKEKFSKEFFRPINSKNIADFIQGQTDEPMFF